MELKKENSKALSRVEKHVFNEKEKGKRNEGIFFSLNQLQNIVDKLREVKSENGVVIDSIAFMIGKKSSKQGRGRKTEYTVEILPFGKKGNNIHLFYEVKKTKDVTGKEYIEVGAMVPPFDIDGGGGGNQKTPPPSS